MKAYIFTFEEGYEVSNNKEKWLEDYKRDNGNSYEDDWKEFASVHELEMDENFAKNWIEQFENGESKDCYGDDFSEDLQGIISRVISGEVVQITCSRGEFDIG
jgi:hypothetical protein